MMLQSDDQTDRISCWGISTGGVRFGLAVFLAVALASYAAWPEPSIFPTGTTRYDPGKAYNSFILFSGADDETYLIDMNGKVVHRWGYGGFPAGMLDPKLTGGKRGRVVLQLAQTAGVATGVNPGLPAMFSNKTLGELDWDGKVVWQWGDAAPGGAARQHHDWQRLANGNTLVLANLYHPIAGFALSSLLDDVIYEVTPAGQIAWQWIAGDHLGEFGFSDAELALVHAVKEPDYLHLNSMRSLGSNHWFAGGDRRFNPDNIMISSRDASIIAIIDKETGHIVWRLGPHYPPSPPPGPPHLPTAIDQISGQHDPHFIPEGLPGAGNLLVFDNEGEAGYPPAPLKVLPGSRVLEIDPVKNEIVWEYTGTRNDRDPWSFYSSFISDARRLPNGNTFIDEGMDGRFFQVTQKGEIVWEYVCPFFGREGSKRPLSNQVYRAQPVPYDWVPAGTPHGEHPVMPPDLAGFHVPAQ
jgi:hypothetical protein